jgi:hypothetical protein
MTTIRLPGVKSYKSNGQVYYYMRRTGARIVDPATGAPIDPVTDLAAFVAQVEAMKTALAAVPKPPKPKAGTLLQPEAQAVPPAQRRLSKSSAVGQNAPAQLASMPRPSGWPYPPQLALATIESLTLKRGIFDARSVSHLIGLHYTASTSRT